MEKSEERKKTSKGDLSLLELSLLYYVAKQDVIHTNHFSGDVMSGKDLSCK